jgi:beta-N-acetylhexosaminidase
VSINISESEQTDIFTQTEPNFLKAMQAAETASYLDERLLAAQVLICGIDGKGNLPSHIKVLFTECPPGGVILFKYNLDTDNNSIRSFLLSAASFIKDESGLPPFIAVDHEGGNVNRFMNTVAELPAASSYWDIFLENGKPKALAKIETDSLKAGREINDLGINMNFAPVAEYLNNDNQNFLKNRSYGPDPVFTAEAAAAFIRGMEQSGILCVVKHFPGSAGPDPHYSASALKGDREYLNKLVSPFTALFSGGARAVMISHSLVPVMDGKIASLSAVVMQNWLRNELGFNGLIICDDFSMAAAGDLSPEEAAVRSLAAGADMVLVWPPDILRTHRSILAALKDGRLSQDRLRSAAQRVIYEKLRMENP